MTNPAEISVDPDEVARHANNLRSLMDSLRLSLEAATYLGAADDGFGEVPRPFVHKVFDGKYQGAIDMMKKLAEDVAVLPDKLDSVAAAFANKDSDFGKSLTDLRETVAEVPGGSK